MMTSSSLFTPETAATLEQLLETSAELTQQEVSLLEQARVWAGQPSGLTLAQYVAEGLPQEVDDWFTLEAALEEQTKVLQVRRTQLQVVDVIPELTRQLETASEQSERELGAIRPLLPLSRQFVQAERQAEDLRTKVNAAQGLGKLWGTLTGRQGALNKELDWVEKQLDRIGREYHALQVRQGVTFSAGQLQAEYERRSQTWNALLTDLQNQHAEAHQAQASAWAKLAAEGQELEAQKREQPLAWSRLVSEYALPDEPAAWLELCERADEGVSLWQAYQHVLTEQEVTRQALKQHWATWPASWQNEQSAQEQLQLWQQRQAQQASAGQVATPLLPWDGEATHFDLTQPSEQEPFDAAVPLYPWGEPEERTQPSAPAPSPEDAEGTEVRDSGGPEDSAPGIELPVPPTDLVLEPVTLPEASQGTATETHDSPKSSPIDGPTAVIENPFSAIVADQEVWPAATALPFTTTGLEASAEVAQSSEGPDQAPPPPLLPWDEEHPNDFEVLAQVEVDSLAQSSPVVTLPDRPESIPGALDGGLAEDLLNAQTSPDSEVAADAWLKMLSPTVFPLPVSEGPSEAYDFQEPLPDLSTLPGNLNVLSRQPQWREFTTRTHLTLEERTRQIAVKVAVETGRPDRVNFIEDQLAGGYAALKAPRLQRQLQTLSDAEIELAEQLYEWWPEQEHYGATYRWRNGEWHRAPASISRQTCEQLVGHFSSVPSFEEVTQLLENLHEHLGYGRVAFSYQVQTILDELTGYVDFERWVNWMTAVAPVQDGEDWADEIDFQNLLRRR